MRVRIVKSQGSPEALYRQLEALLGPAQTPERERKTHYEQRRTSGAYVDRNVEEQAITQARELPYTYETAHSYPDTHGVTSRAAMRLISNWYAAHGWKPLTKETTDERLEQTFTSNDGNNACTAIVRTPPNREPEEPQTIDVLIKHLR